MKAYKSMTDKVQAGEVEFGYAVIFTFRWLALICS